MLAATAIVGAAVGAGLTQVIPPTLTSSALVLLPTPIESQSYGESDVDTQSKIVLSTTVLGAAGATFTPTLSAYSMEKHVTVSAETDQLLQITATSTQRGRAAALTGAVTEAYLAYVNSSAQAVGDSALASIRSREDALQKQEQALTQEIARSTARQRAAAQGSTQARSEAQIIAQLQAERADLLVQLDRVQDSLATTPSGFNAGAIVVQDASPERPPPMWNRLALWMPAGAWLSVLLVASIALIVERRQRVLRLRDEIAVVVGSPVLGSVRAQQQRTTVDWSALLATYSAGPAEDWAWRRALSNLPGSSSRTGGLSHPRSMTLICLAGDGPGLALPPQLATYAIGRGVTTRLTVANGQQAVAQLWTVMTSYSRDQLRPGLLLGPERDQDPEPDLTLTMIVVDRTSPDLTSLSDSDAIVFVVSSGVATEEDVVRLNVGLDAHGRRFDGVIVANPEGSDHTTGTKDVIVDDEVSRLPIRVTGSPTLRRTTNE